MNAHYMPALFIYRQIFFYLFIGLSQLLFAQKNVDNVHVAGRIVDSFTHELLSGATVEAMYSDSSLIGTFQTTTRNSTISGNKVNLFGFYVPRPGHCILRISRKGYETKYVVVEAVGKRVNYALLEEVLLHKSKIQLAEVRVTASKIKMVMKKDTIEFNADAFQLSQGSMLDALIRQLPGVELKSDGRILVNGRFVSSLLINGEDFFKGDPKVALDNLPAYMVNKVKVYEKEASDSYITGKRPEGENPLVVDVNLKRQYSVGWIANAETAYGTHDRYMGSFFGLRFTDHSRLALFGNMNNTNDTREPGFSGSWTPAKTASGQTALKSGGAELLVNDKNGKWKLQSNIKALYEDVDNRQETSEVRFFQGGDVFRRSRSMERSNQFNIVSEHQFQIKLPKVFLQLSPGIKYSHYDRHNSVYNATFKENPYESYRGASLDSLFFHPRSSRLDRILINRQSELTKGNGNEWVGDFSGQATFGIPNTPDYLVITANGHFDRFEDEQYSRYYLHYNDIGHPSDFRNRYQNSPRRNYDFDMKARYTYKGKGLWISPSYSYKQTYQSSDRSLYRLEHYEGWNDPDGTNLGELPSTRDSLQQSMDRKNSYYSTSRSYIHMLQSEFVVFLRGGESNLQFVPCIRFETDKLHYLRDELNSKDSRRTFAFEPRLAYRFDDFGLEYRFSVSEPSLTLFLDITDDVDPLNHWRGNSSLKNVYHHNINIRRSWRNRKYQRNLSVGADYNLWSNAISQSATYNRSTGVTTYRPENINGNWNVKGFFNFSQVADTKKRLQLSTTTNMEYLNSVDLVSVENVSASNRSSVRSLNMGEMIRADYKLRNYFFGLKVLADWTYAHSPREDFSTVSSIDFSYGFTAQIPLPWNMELNTDMTMYSRRGYNDHSMNTNDWIWNARLTKRFLKGGNLLCMIDGFDLLHQISNIRRKLNVQGQVETWYNTLPNYIMVHCIYRLNLEPKKIHQKK